MYIPAGIWAGAHHLTLQNVPQIDRCVRCSAQSAARPETVVDLPPAMAEGDAETFGTSGKKRTREGYSRTTRKRPRHTTARNMLSSTWRRYARACAAPDFKTANQKACGAAVSHDISECARENKTGTRMNRTGEYWLPESFMLSYERRDRRTKYRPPPPRLSGGVAHVCTVRMRVIEPPYPDFVT